MNWKKSSMIMFLIMFVFLVGCNTNKNETNASEQQVLYPVELSEVSKGLVAEKVTLSGTVMASKQMVVLPMVAGEIKAVYVQNGDFVLRGDKLVELNSTDMELNIAQARAGLEAAEANLRGTKAMHEQNLKQAEQQYRQAKELLAFVSKAEEEVPATPLDLSGIPVEIQELIKRLVANSDSTTTMDLEQAKAAVQKAEMALNQAKSTIQIDATEASVKQARIGVELAEQQKGRTVVTAPISGQITNFRAGIGEIASPQLPLLQIVEMENPVVHVNVNELLVSKLVVGQEVEVFVRALENTYKGTIEHIGIIPAEQSRAYPVEIVINDDIDQLRVGMMAEVNISDPLDTEEVVVPVEAVVFENNETIVYVTKDGKHVEKRTIITKGESSSHFAVEKGLAEGELVVVKGIHQLFDEAFINVRNEVGGFTN